MKCFFPTTFLFEVWSSARIRRRSHNIAEASGCHNDYFQESRPMQCGANPFLQIFMSRDNDLRCAAAAARGDLEALIQTRTVDGCPWDEWTCAKAVKGGHLGILKCARENGCRWNEATCAAAGGHLEVLQWARENGYPWDECTCICAVLEGHAEVLRWALANGCEWNYTPDGPCNNVEILQLAYEYCVLYNPETSGTSAECLEFLNGEYGEAWKKMIFGLPHAWNIHINGTNE